MRPCAHGGGRSVSARNHDGASVGRAEPLPTALLPRSAVLPQRTGSCARLLACRCDNWDQPPSRSSSCHQRNIRAHRESRRTAQIFEFRPTRPRSWPRSFPRLILQQHCRLQFGSAFLHDFAFPSCVLTANLRTTRFQKVRTNGAKKSRFGLA